jgi:hypothetical protein
MSARIYPPRNVYMPNSSYYNVSSYMRELKRLRSQDTFDLYGEPNIAMFDAARQMSYLIIETGESVRSGYKKFKLLKKKDARKFIAEEEEKEQEKIKNQKPTVFNPKEIWIEETA